MKLRTSLSILLITILLASCMRSTQHFPFKGDSGYLTKKQIWPYALAHQVYDSVELKIINQRIGDSDITAKYYQLEEPGHYLVCMNDLIPGSTPFYMIEVMPDGEIKNKQVYHHLTLRNSWTDSMGFWKKNDYLYLRLIESGCFSVTTDLYVFKKMLPHDSLHTIPESIYGQGIREDELFRRYVNGKFQMGNDTIFAHYSVREVFSESTREILDSFDVTYLPKAGGWHTTDTANLIKYWGYYIN